MTAADPFASWMSDDGFARVDDGPTLSITRWPSGLYSKKGERVSMRWRELVALLRKDPPRVALERLQWSEKESKWQKPKTDSGFSLATFGNDGPRANENVEHVFGLVLDEDGESGMGVDDVAEVWSSFRGAVFPTFNSEARPDDVAAPTAPRTRAVLLYSRAVTAAEHARIWTWAREFAAERGMRLDDQPKDAARFWFDARLPANAPPFQFAELSGKAIDVDAILASESRRKTEHSSPGSSRATANAPPTAPSMSDSIARISASTRRKRAAAYLSRAEASVSGERGHDNAMRVVTAAVRGFALDRADALDVLASWNARCEPPWSARELAHKVDEAIRAGALAWGAKLLDVREDADARKQPKGSTPINDPPSPASRVRALVELGPVVRLETGIRTLDRACRGGVPTRRLVVLGGAPGAGKTSLATWLAWQWAKAGIPVAMLAVDEGPDGVLMRIAQLEGFNPAGIEERDPDMLEKLAARLETMPLLVVDAEDAAGTVEGVADLLTRHAKAGPAVLVVDSLQTVRASGTEDADSPRERVDAVVRSLKAARDRGGFLVVATCELARGAYRSRNQAEAINDLAAFKESGSVEYAAQTALVLRSVPDETSLIDVTVPKNRAYKRDGFRLRLDHATTAFEEVDAPPPSDGGKGREYRRDHVRSAIVNIVAREQLRSARQIVKALRESGHKFRDADALDTVRVMQDEGVLIRAGKGPFRIASPASAGAIEEGDDDAA